MNLTLFTATCDRPEAFALTERWIAQQTVKPFQWIVADDGTTPVTCTQGQEHFYLPHLRGFGSMVNKLKQVLLTGAVKGDALVFIEDDDYVKPTWLQFCLDGLARYEIVGEGHNIYFNVRRRWWFRHNNMGHASLCATALRRSCFDVLLKECQKSDDPFLDARLWEQLKKRGNVFHNHDPLVVGIKEMPGRLGYSRAHSERDPGAIDDLDLKKLRHFLGGDFSYYEKFYDTTPYPVPQPTRPTMRRVGPTARIKPEPLRTAPPIAKAVPLPPPSTPLKIEAHTETGKAHGPNWMRWLGHLQDKEGAIGLEIGTFRGDSAEFMCENIFTGKDAKYFCIDPFTGSPEHELNKIDCTTNEKFARERLSVFKQVTITKGLSEHYLPWAIAGLRKGTFKPVDAVYCDGLHTSQAALRDGVMAFELLKVGGILIWDDYNWEAMPRPIDRPKIGIDAFLAAYADQIEILAPRGWQVSVKKTK